MTVEIGFADLVKTSHLSTYSSIGLGQGWRTFFGEHAKIMKIKFSKLMPCLYIE